MPPMRRPRRVHRRRRRRRVLLVGGLVAVGVHKMSQKDAKRIEEATGQPPEDLTDEQLTQAMKQLGIEDQRVTPEDKEQGAGGASASAAATPAPASSTGATPSAGYLDELQKLSDLHDKGILTDEEFAAKKAKILGL